MNSNLTFLLLICVAATLVISPGCTSETAVKEDTGANPETHVVEDSDEAQNLDKPNPVGEWKIDPQAMIEANSALLKNPGIDSNQFKTSVRRMIMDFLIEPDNKFFCYEKADGVEADYAGTWKLNGNQIGLYQKTRDDQKEEDELVGTIEGDRMDLVHKQQGVSINIVLVR